MELNKRNEAVVAEMISFAEGETKALAWNQADEHIVLAMIDPEGKGGKATVKAGDGPLAAQKDLELNLSGGSAYLVKLDSGRYKQHTGENAGCVVITAQTEITAFAAAII